MDLKDGNPLENDKSFTFVNSNSCHMISFVASTRHYMFTSNLRTGSLIKQGSVPEHEFCIVYLFVMYCTSVEHS